MSFVVSARKYRPLSFDNVLGQKHITDTLKNALVNDKLAHAYLFTGPRGVGKTTCARILAQVINCENVVDSNPCGECSSCKSFRKNASFNIIELDAASNNSVEHIRSLNEQVRFQPQQGKYKVFIIDEVHMLSQSAFNAFLKTLEEPPPYAIFILATTEKHKIIPTILSRCQIYDFRRIKLAEMVKQMTIIAEKESIEIDAEAMFLIAEKADGAMRDALSIFDRIVSSSDSQITYKDIIEKLNILDYDYYFRISNEILKKDGSACLKIYDEIISKGFEGDQFLLGFSEHLRNLFIAKDSRTASIQEGSKELYNRYADQAALFSMSELLTALDAINKSDVEYPFAKNKRLAVEIALLKLCYYQDKIIQQSEVAIEKKNPIATSPIKKELTPTKTIKKEAQIPKKASKEKIIAKTPVQNTPSLSSIDNLLSQVKEEEKKSNKPRKEASLADIKKIWEEHRLGQKSPSVANVLKKVFLELKGNILTIDVPSNVAKEHIHQEVSLFERVREELNFSDLELNINVNRDKFPDLEINIPKTYLTDKEKIEKLSEDNPNLSKLIKTFNLVPID